MSETTPDPADVHTGTDRVADVEAQIQADFEAHPGSWRGDPEGWFREGWLVQEARLQALAVELDQLKEEVSEYVFEYIPLIAGQRDKAEADLDAARAELASANARCAELEQKVAYLQKRLEVTRETIHRQSEAQGFDGLLDQRDALQETLDRVTALADEWEAEAAKATRPVRKMGAGSRADKFIQGHATNLARQAKRLRAALTPEGTE